MEKLILLLVLPLSVSSGDIGHCKGLEALATSVMEGRQLGVPMSNMMDALLQDNKEVSALTQEMIMQAYEKPGYRTESNRKASVVRFANQWAAFCYRDATE